jgi:hypothetical protein
MLPFPAQVIWKNPPPNEEKKSYISESPNLGACFACTNLRRIVLLNIIDGGERELNSADSTIMNLFIITFSTASDALWPLNALCWRKKAWALSLLYFQHPLNP